MLKGKKIEILKVEPLNPALVLGYEEEQRIESILTYSHNTILEFNVIVAELNTHFEEHKIKAHKYAEASKTAKKKEEVENFTKAAKLEIQRANEFK